MAELIREISATVEVDTTKRTISRTISADSFLELQEEIERAINDIKGDLDERNSG